MESNILILLLAFSQAVSSVTIDPSEYCIQYYGSIRANIELPDTVPQLTNDGEDLCFTSWPPAYDERRGAVLRLCPPLTDSNRDSGSIMDLRLNFGYTQNSNEFPIDSFTLQDIAITNGSSSFASGESAMLAPHGDWRWDWSINGTGKAIQPNPNIETWEGVVLSCFNMEPDPRIVCGGDCWSQQKIPFNTQEMTYTVLFSDEEAMVEIHAESEFEDTGANTIVDVIFRGDRKLPSMTDYEFWTHAKVLNYEALVAEQNSRTWAMMLGNDSQGFPVFGNKTKDSPFLEDDDERYFSKNATYSVEQSGGSFGGGKPSLAMILVVSVLVAFFGWC